MKRKNASNNLLSFTKYTMTDFKVAKHHKLICEKLEAVERGDIKRLMIFTPPRHAKSELVSKRFPAWFLGRSPWKQFITASYGADLAQGFGRDVRNTFDTKEFQNVFPHASIAKDCAAKNYWKTTSNGIYVAIGVGGGLTGKGGHCCMLKGTKVVTKFGERNVEEIQPGDEVLAYDFSGSYTKFSKVLAVASKAAPKRCRLYTKNGRVVEATPEHLFCSGSGWTPISALVPEDILLGCDDYEPIEDKVDIVVDVCFPGMVYDLEVEGTHCFFANNILVHNCVIDDPVKDRQDAESSVMQERTWDWYRSVLRTRLMPNAAIVLVMTRWHPMDLAGRLIDAMHSGGEQWEIVNLPALSTMPDDPLGRKLGEALWPEWFPEEDLRKIEASVGPREWSALYQQEPVTGSEFFSAAQFLVADRPVVSPLAIKFVYATVDTTQKGGKGRDGTAVSYWALQELKVPGQYPLTLLDWDIVEHEGGLLDIWFPQVFQRLEELSIKTKARNGSIGAFVEDKAAGSILLQQAPRFGWPMHAIDSKLTSVGKDARAINASSYVNQGLVKMSLEAFDKTLAFRGAVRNHWLSQVTNFRVGQDGAGREDDLFDSAMYGIALGLGNAEGF